ncbi:ribosome biogenesis GTPase Der [Thermocrinis sp.]
MKIVIVGRPNVGKSTLFNRIVGKRISIVHGIPGVTRDAIESVAEWKGRRFKVVDTGGLIESEEYITKEIRRRVEKLLEEADAILFVVDGKEGITSADQSVAELLYPHKEKVFLVVNKMDTKTARLNLYDFYSLAFERVYPVSAQHGKGVGELLDDVLSCVGEKEEVIQQEGIRLSFVGRPNVGKSSLVNAILGSDRVIVSPIAGTTRDAVEIFFEYKGESLILVDTAGLRRPSKVEYGLEFFSVGRSIKAIDMSDVVCLVVDLSEGVTHQDQKIGSLIERRYKGCVIVGNKFDLTNLRKEEVEAYIRQRLYFLDYAPVVLTVATEGKGIKELLESALLVYKDYCKQHKTSFINRAVEKIISEKAPPSYQGKEVKVYYAYQESTKPPTVVLYTNYPEGWKSNYRRFFERKLREYLNIKHSPIKLVLRSREEGG